MNKKRIKRQGFTWMYYPVKGARLACIVSLGQDDHGPMIQAAARYLGTLGVSVLGLAPVYEDLRYSGWHSFPLETFEEGARFLLEEGHAHVFACGGSTTAMLAITAACYIPTIEGVIALTPCDFMMEGFYRGMMDGKPREWPAKTESCVTWRGEPVPYSPYHLDDQTYHELSFGHHEAGERGLNLKRLFEHVEGQEEFETGYLPVERSQAKFYLFGAEDDSIWETCRYIRRLADRMQKAGKGEQVETFIYEKGTHFVFPQRMLKHMLPVPLPDFLVRWLVGRLFEAGKNAPEACEETRKKVDAELCRIVEEWKQN